MATEQTAVLIVGGGGREHATGWNIAQSPKVGRVLYAPGNPRTGTEEKSENVFSDGKPLNGADPKNFPKLADIIEAEDVGMVVVGPEAPLAGGEDGSNEGLVDFLAERGYHNVIGPTKTAATIEADKFYSYGLMEELDIPQAEAIKCYTTDQAREAIRQMSTPQGVVIKARGLTAGKGVWVCDSKDEALSRIEQHAQDYSGDGKHEVLIAKRLLGQEFSVFGISDGDHIYTFEIALQDHKPLLDDDFGPNTGGMGAYGPTPIAHPKVVRDIGKNIMTPVIQRMKANGTPFRGVLYAGMMMVDGTPHGLEFNIRFGDPEMQPLAMMLEDNLFDPLSLSLEGRVNEASIGFKQGTAFCVTMASNGYPAEYKKGRFIDGIEEAEKIPGVKVFHAGTALNEQGKLVTSGGRVLGVTAYDPQHLIDARDTAYAAVNIIDRFTTRSNEMLVFIYRNDIADKALTG